MKRLLLMLVVLVLAMTACVPNGPTPTPQIVYVEVTPLSIPVTPTGTPAPITKPVWAGLTIHGTTEIVTDNYELPECTKMVVTWESKTDSDYAFLIVRYVNVLQSQKVGIEEGSGTVVNYGESVTGGVGRGSVLFPTMGGTYFFEISNITGPWSLNFDCQD
jgi:hypothetical protein